MEYSSIDRVRENLRLQQVYNVFLRYGWDFFFDRQPMLNTFRHTMQAWVWRVPKENLEHVSVPVKTRLMLEELGPTYVKLGQIVSSQSSVVPPEWEVELEKLQSNVPPFPADQVRQIIIEELGAPPEVLFGTFEEQPFAAASTAQVHKATLLDGSPVAVKVQRPFIYNQMKSDIGILQNAARVFTARSKYMRSIDLAGMLNEFGNSVLRELDYYGEAYNTIRLANDMATIPGVRTAHVYSNLSTSKVLTLEFVRGVKITNLEAIDAAGLDRKMLAINALTALVRQLLINGFFHADPHPGNLLVSLEDGTIYFLDCGMVGELNLQQRLNLIQLMYTISQVDIPGMAQVLRSMSEPFIPDVDDNAFYKDFERSIGRYFYAGTNPSFGELVNNAMNLLRTHGLRLNPNLTMAVKALMQGEAVSTTLAPEGGLLATGIQIIREQALEVVTPDRIVAEGKKQLTFTARELLKQLPDLSTATLSWLKQYKKGRFEITLDTSELAKEVDKFTHLGRMIVISLILVGMLIGSAIATAALSVNPLVASSTYWTFAVQLAYLSFIASVVIAGLIVLRLLWRWLRGDKPELD